MEGRNSAVAIHLLFSLWRVFRADREMSALGQKQTWRSEIPMSALLPKADIPERDCHVRFVPTTDIGRAGQTRVIVLQTGAPTPLFGMV